jgi:acyl CoA:acetate/3-ketoacid CoA transferase beta subunit
MPARVRGTDAPRGARGMSYATLTRNEIAARIAGDISEGAYVNLGIGMPTVFGNLT